MATQAQIIGVRPVEANEPVHLIELLIEGDVGEFDISEVTQEVADQPKSNWQVPYDVQPARRNDWRIPAQRLCSLAGPAAGNVMS